MEKITFEDKDGNLMEYDVVMAFYSSKFKKHYVVYTDNKLEDNKYNYYAISYNPYDKADFKKITSDDEWKEIELVVSNGTRDYK